MVGGKAIRLTRTKSLLGASFVIKMLKYFVSGEHFAT